MTLWVISPYNNLYKQAEIQNVPMKQKAPETPQSIRQHKIHFYRQIAYAFIGAAIVVLLGLIYFSLSQALIVVKPSLEEVSADFNVLVKTDGADLTNGVAAQLVVADVSLERTGEGELLAEGDPQQATGTVTLINTSSQAQPLVATTRLLSEEGVLFRLTDGETVPANGEIQAAVYADEPGKAGEIGPTRFTIPGLNQTRQQEVYAESSTAMTGGTAATYRITQEAVDAAIEETKDRLAQEARAQLKEQGIDTSLLLASAQHVEVKNQTVEPAVGEDAQQFSITMEATVAFVLSDEAALVTLAQQKLYETTSLGYELSSSDEGSFEYSVENFDLEDGTAQLRIVMRGERRIGSDNPLLNASNFVGEKPDELKSRLESNEGIESVEVTLRPFWLRKVPRLVDHIFIQFAD